MAAICYAPTTSLPRAASIFYCQVLVGLENILSAGRVGSSSLALGQEWLLPPIVVVDQLLLAKVFLELHLRCVGGWSLSWVHQDHTHDQPRICRSTCGCIQDRLVRMFWPFGGRTHSSCHTWHSAILKLTRNICKRWRATSTSCMSNPVREIISGCKDWCVRSSPLSGGVAGRWQCLTCVCVCVPVKPTRGNTT